MEDINFGSTGSLNQAGLFENVGSPSAPQFDGGANAAQIDNIFTDGGVLLNVTIASQLNLILKDLLGLTVDSHGNLTGTTP